MSLTDELVAFLLARTAEDEADFSTYARDRGWSDEFTDRMLAECEAKRRIVEDCMPGLGEGDYYAGQDHLYEKVLQALALPYADHADYDETWRP